MTGPLETIIDLTTLSQHHHPVLDTEPTNYTTSKIFPLPQLISTRSLPLPSHIWESRENLVGTEVYLRSHEIPTRFPRDSHEIPTRFPRGFTRDSQEVPVRFPNGKYSQKIPKIRFPKGPRGPSANNQQTRTYDTMVWATTWPRVRQKVGS